MKKVVIFLMIALGLMSAVFVILPFSQSQSSKISSSVYASLQTNSTVNVLIRVNTAQKHGILTLFSSPASINKSETANNIASEIGKKGIAYSRNGLIYARINSSDLAKLQANNNVESVTPERVFHIDSETPTAEVNVSAVQKIKFDGVNLTGKGQTVCIIDTGVDYNNSNLGGCYGNNNVSSNCKVIGGYNFINNTANPMDDNGHGTHVAGILAASGNVTGVAPGVKIIAIKSCDANGNCAESNIQKGFDWCLNNASKFNITVISMSIGTSQLYSGECNSDPLASSVNSATAENISVVAASGNSANYTAMASPACIGNVTAVGDTYVQNYTGSISWGQPVVCTDTDPVVNEIVCHSNRDSKLELLAPGALINSTWLNNGYKTEGGTSMATPHVSAAIAIMKQYLSLNNLSINPQQAESALNKTGEQTFDSKTGLTFSRINIYSALISIDKEPPAINLTTPGNNSASAEQNQTFECNATDLALKNITLDIWNSTDLYYNQTRNISGQNNLSQFNVSNIPNGKYYWNCFSEDQNNNTGSSVQNSTFSILPGTVYLSPSNNTYTNKNLTMQCNSTYFWTNETLSNVTIDIFNSSNMLVYNLSKQISGNSNLTNFSYNFTSQGSYSWGCHFYTNESSKISSENYTVTYDITSPEVNLTSPSNNTKKQGGTQNVDFYYNSTDNIGLNNCSLKVNGNTVMSNSTITQKDNMFRHSLPPGTYTWNVKCFDKAGNSNSSIERSITIEAAPSSYPESYSSASGGYSTSPQPKVQNKTSPAQPEISAKKTEKGYDLILPDNSGYFFTINKTEKHLISVGNVSANSAKITVRSDPITFTLEVGQDKNLNLTSPEYYDLNVKLNSINNKSANITLTETNESNRMFHILNSSSEGQKTKSPKGEIITKLEVEIFAAVIILLMIAVSYKLEKKKLSKIVENPPGKEKKQEKNKKTKQKI